MEKISAIIITISSFLNSGYGPENTINYESDDYWHSQNNQGEWWEINFKEMKVKMNGYSLQSVNNINYLKNWVIEGKNEGVEWKEIER